MDNDEVEPASFRDVASTVFYRGGEVYRALSASALADWTAMSTTGFFSEAMASGRIVGTELASIDAPPDALGGSATAVLRHERVPFVSYPYEWPFHMLKEGALAHLDLLTDALNAGVTMKDGYAYNVQFVGARPVFIDVMSFEPATGGPWAGYRQFCQTFLFPLMLQAQKRVPFQPWLRGSLEGISPVHMRGFYRGRDVFRTGVLKHVMLHAAVEARFSDKGANDTKAEMDAAGFSNQLALAAVRGIRKTVAKLEWKPKGSTWNDYRQTCTYTDADAEAKQTFVRRALAASRPSLVWDLGANDGAYSRIAAETADFVVATDLDDLVVDNLYGSLRSEGHEKILPLVFNIADPSPDLGWRATERRQLEARGRPDTVLALALIHHLVIGANLPMAGVIDWLASVTDHLVIEFVDANDPQTKRLLANKPPERHRDYTVENFERLLADRFDIASQETLASSTRVLYDARRR
ncbi:MAG TPA: hypothetical protein VNB24_06105 [Acidimicrobiales bacterium]|nr:hypothetical protein [Acidimicrobiales bacterium]